MNDADEPGEARRLTGFDRGFDGHWRRQVRRGLALTPAQRLRWLEQAMDELRPLVGRARRVAPPSDPTRPNSESTESV